MTRPSFGCPRRTSLRTLLSSERICRSAGNDPERARPLVRWDRSRSGTSDDARRDGAVDRPRDGVRLRHSRDRRRDFVDASAWKIAWKRHRASSRLSIEQRIGSSDLRAFVRLSVEWPTLQRAAAGSGRPWTSGSTAYARRSIPVLLAIGPRAGSSAETDNWVPVIQAVARHLAGAGRRLSDRGGDDIARSA